MALLKVPIIMFIRFGENNVCLQMWIQIYISIMGGGRRWLRGFPYISRFYS